MARFHLANGARIERINAFADPSDNGVAQAYGFMVNYLYERDRLESNHASLFDRGEVAANPALRRLADARARLGPLASEIAVEGRRSAPPASDIE